MRKIKQREFASEWQFDKLTQMFSENDERARETMIATLRRASERLIVQWPAHRKEEMKVSRTR